MIVFDLKCAPQGHVFEGWFGSSGDYEDQQTRGLVACPLCGSDEVGKAPMAPAVSAKSNMRNVTQTAVQAPAGGGAAAPPAAAALAMADPQAVKAMLAAAAAIQKSLLEKSESVGDRFADEARAIHLGDADARPIHGRATPEQAAALVDEGIQIAPLPFPVIDPGEEN
ncbi:DUF1178 family protein [Allosphingosinicella deserti]|uniref:DUF1178 domain-containing protein n=1 Tax=Allosphingosinicella deserti TaxID=2116704 RepID=A0A2P7QP38_9SPHN|nr:DUF1178 family protein [Sphingomonas deserti]PSJ39745.1 DUF1178 domain-containing protein [Sphingomonas deserti]